MSIKVHKAMPGRQSVTDRLLFKKIIKVSSFFFGRSAYLAWPFAGMKTGGLVL